MIKSLLLKIMGAMSFLGIEDNKIIIPHQHKKLMLLMAAIKISLVSQLHNFWWHLLSRYLTKILIKEFNHKNFVNSNLFNK